MRIRRWKNQKQMMKMNGLVVLQTGKPFSWKIYYLLFEFKFNLSRWHSYKSEKALLDAEDAETTSSSWGDINSLGKWSAWYFIIADVGPS